MTGKEESERFDDIVNGCFMEKTVRFDRGIEQMSRK